MESSFPLFIGTYLLISITASLISSTPFSVSSIASTTSLMISLG